MLSDQTYYSGFTGLTKDSRQTSRSKNTKRSKISHGSGYKSQIYIVSNPISKTQVSNPKKGAKIKTTSRKKDVFEEAGEKRAVPSKLLKKYKGVSATSGTQKEFQSVELASDFDSNPVF